MSPDLILGAGAGALIGAAALLIYLDSTDFDPPGWLKWLAGALGALALIGLIARLIKGEKERERTIKESTAAKDAKNDLESADKQTADALEDADVSRADPRLGRRANERVRDIARKHGQDPDDAPGFGQVQSDDEEEKPEPNLDAIRGEGWFLDSDWLDGSD